MLGWKVGPKGEEVEMTPADVRQLVAEIWRLRPQGLGGYDFVMGGRLGKPDEAVEHERLREMQPLGRRGGWSGCRPERLTTCENWYPSIQAWANWSGLATALAGMATPWPCQLTACWHGWPLFRVGHRGQLRCPQAAVWFSASQPPGHTHPE